MAGVELDPGHNLLAVLLARDADHLHIRHRWMREEKLLQLTRVNVLTAANDHVLVAPGDAHVTLFIHGR
ncbi:hypothetical protein D3C71_1989280 [compost metagenome]